jgi:hypothetical protein
MPKFEFNPRTGQMEIKKPTGIEFFRVGGGLKVTDHDLPASFIILRDTDEIGYANGRAAMSVKIFDIRKSRMIADRVKRIMPNSKYTNYTHFCKGVKTLESLMSEEDTNLLEGLLEQYGETAINESVSNITDNILNEGYGPSVLNPKWSDNQTRGAVDVGPNKKRLRGLGGFVKTLPSMAISFVICPPLACIQLLGAVRHRMEKKWLGRLFNSKTWLDFIATPSEKQEELKQKMKDAFAEKTQFYYTTLANGEILKVPAINTLEAKDMVLAITRKELIPRYQELDSDKSKILKEVTNNGQKTTAPGISAGQGNRIADTITYSDRDCKMWAVKFSDGQCCYMFGPEGQRDEIKEKAQESKKAVIDYYKKIKLKGKDGDDNEDSKTLKHKGLGTDTKDGTEFLDEMFVYPTVDDMYEIKNTGMYEMITEDNEKDFSTPSTGQPGPWQPLDYPIFTIPVGQSANQPNKYAAIFKIVASTPKEAGEIVKRILEDNDIKNIIQLEQKTIAITDEQILNEFAQARKEETPFRKSTTSIVVCGSEFTFTCIDNGVYKVDNNGNNSMKLLSSYDVATKNNNNYIYTSAIDGSDLILNKIKKAFEAAYSSEDVDKNVKKIFMERLVKTSTKVKVEKLGEYTYTPAAGQLAFHDNTRHDVVVADWNALANAVSHDVDVPDCYKERPSGEKLDSGITITIAAAA